MGEACFACTKILFSILNLIFLLTGLVGCGLCLYYLFDDTFSLKFTQDPGDTNISLIILAIAGFLLFLGGVFGIWGALQERKCCIVLCFSLLLIIVVAEVSALVWGYVHRDELQNQIQIAVKNTVKKDYHENNDVRRVYDAIQEKLQCCGGERPDDWIDRHDMSVSSTNNRKAVIPDSCCRQNLNTGECGANRITGNGQPNFKVVYDKGCFPLIMEKLQEAMPYIYAIGGTILGLQVLGLIIALCLAFSLNRSNRYKA